MLKIKLSIKAFKIASLLAFFIATSFSANANGFNYESESKFTYGKGKLCLVTTCTDTSGSDCTTVDSSIRDCVSFIFPVILV